MTIKQLHLILIAFLVFPLCSFKNIEKKKIDLLTYPIQGLWIGKYSVTGEQHFGSQYFSFIIKPDGTMINDTRGAGQQHIAVGTWALKGKTFICSFTCIYGSSSNIGITETATAKWDKTGKLTNGVWKNVAPLTGSGRFELKRVN